MRFHPALRYRDGDTVRRFPALVAAVTGNADDASGGTILGVQRTWLDPRRPAKDATLLVGEGIETVLSLITAVPEIDAAALSAGSLGAFALLPGTARLVIARDNDPDGARAAERLGRARRSVRASMANTVPGATAAGGRACGKQKHTPT